MAASFEDGKAEGALRTIGEVSEALGIKAHILRYWEGQFPQLQPMKRSGGRRYYRPADVALVTEIDRLVNREGYTLRGAKAALRDFRAPVQPVEPVQPPVPSLDAQSNTGAPPSPSPSPSASADNAVTRLRAIRRTLAAALEA